jgi:hypothetical protein
MKGSWHLTHSNTWNLKAELPCHVVSSSMDGIVVIDKHHSIVLLIVRLLLLKLSDIFINNDENYS